MNKLREAIEEALQSVEPGEVRVSYPDGTSKIMSTLTLATDDILSLVLKELLEGKPEKKSTNDEDIRNWEDGHRNAGFNEGIQAFENHIKNKLGGE